MTRSINTTSNNIREEIKHIIGNEFRKYGGGVALDCWTDRARKATYFGLTIHYYSIDNAKLYLNDRVLVIRELSELKKSGEYIKSKIMQFMTEFRLLDCLENNLIFVSDRGTNMVSSMHNFKNIHCFAHMMNNTVGKIFEKIRDVPENQQRWAYRMVNAITSIVKYFKSSGLNVLFKPALKSNVSTRWNSVFMMLDSVIIHWNKITDILCRSRKHLADLQLVTLDELILLRNFLEPFKKATDELEASKRPTLFLVYPNYFNILEHLKPSASDPHCIAECKTIAQKYWTENVHNFLTKYHGVALFLHPMMKALRMQTPTERNTIWSQTIQMMENFQPSVVTQMQYDKATKRKNNQKNSILLCLDDSETDEEGQCPLNIEMDDYKSIRFRKMDTEEFDLLEWWHSNQTKFPRLYGVARFIHSIPASSAAAERLFSIAG